MDTQQVIERLANLADLYDKQQSNLDAEAREARGIKRDYAVDFKAGLAGGLRIARTLLLAEIANIKRRHSMDNALLVRPEGPTSGRIGGVEL